MNTRMIFAWAVAGAAMAVAFSIQGEPTPPKIEDYTHVCRTCGKTTHYPTSELGPRSFITEYRKGCAALRDLGLDATLDESVLCRHCVSAEKLKIPRFATVRFRSDYTFWRKGDRVEVVPIVRGNGRVLWHLVPIGNKYWVNGRYIDAEGNILGNNICIRLHPDLNDLASGHANRGMKMRILPRAAGDPLDWVAVEWRDPRIVPCSLSCFENVEYGEGEDASLVRITKHLEWTIGGNRHPVDRFDLDLLLAYMRGQTHVLVGCIMTPIDKYMPRIQELLPNRMRDRQATTEATK